MGGANGGHTGAADLAAAPQAPGTGAWDAGLAGSATLSAGRVAALAALSVCCECAARDRAGLLRPELGLGMPAGVLRLGLRRTALPCREPADLHVKRGQNQNC